MRRERGWVVPARERGWAVPAIVLAAALALAASGCGELSRGELSRGVDALSGLAAQGGLIAGGVARDDTKATYARVMAKTLGEEAEHEAEKLADAEPSPAVRDERHAAVRLAGEIAELFSELQTFPGDERQGAAVQRGMREAGEEADALLARVSGEEQ
jgi:hypothetical protein